MWLPLGWGFGSGVEVFEGSAKSKINIEEGLKSPDDKKSPDLKNWTIEILENASESWKVRSIRSPLILKRAKENHKKSSWKWQKVCSQQFHHDHKNTHLGLEIFTLIIKSYSDLLKKFTWYWSQKMNLNQKSLKSDFRPLKPPYIFSRSRLRVLLFLLLWQKAPKTPLI